MRHLLRAIGITGLLALMAGTASAQDFGVRIGVDWSDDRFERRERRIERRIGREDFDDRPAVRVRRVEEYDDVRPRGRIVEERRIIRRAAPVRTVCRNEIRERIRPDGAYVRKPVQVCRQIVGARRVFVD